MDTGQSDEIFRNTRLRASILQTFERKYGNDTPITFPLCSTEIRWKILLSSFLPSSRKIFLQANNRYLEDKMLNFLILDLYGVTSLERKIIFFYCTYSVEKYQEEVSVWQSEWSLPLICFVLNKYIRMSNRVASKIVDCKQTNRALLN